MQLRELAEGLGDFFTDLDMVASAPGVDLLCSFSKSIVDSLPKAGEVKVQGKRELGKCCQQLVVISSRGACMLEPSAYHTDRLPTQLFDKYACTINCVRVNAMLSRRKADPASSGL